MNNNGSLVSFSAELSKNIDDMREKRDMLRTQIFEEEEEKNKIENEIANLIARLEKTNEIIAKYTNEYMELEKTVSETESAKAKIAESYKTLLSVLQKETLHLAKTKI